MRRQAGRLDASADRGISRRGQQFYPLLGRRVSIHGGAHRLAQSKGQVGRKATAWVRRTAAQAQRLQQMTLAQSGVDLLHPLLVQGSHPAGQGISQGGGQLTDVLVAGAGSGVDAGHHRPQVAQGDLVNGGHRRLGTIPPAGRLESRQELLGHGQQGLSVDRRAPLGPGPGALSLHHVAHRGQAPAQDLLGDGALLGRKAGHQGVAVSIGRVQAPAPSRLAVMGRRCPVALGWAGIVAWAASVPGRRRASPGPAMVQTAAGTLGPVGRRSARPAGPSSG